MSFVSVLATFLTLFDFLACAWTDVSFIGQGHEDPDTLNGRLYLHYEFPPYCVNETGKVRVREISTTRAGDNLGQASRALFRPHRARFLVSCSESRESSKCFSRAHTQL